MELTTHPGIGDLSWIYSKLVNCGEELDLIIAEDAKHKRALPFMGLLPNVKSAKYGKKEDYEYLATCGNNNFSDYKKAEAEGMRLFCSANNYLEKGNRLESFLPDLETDFHYEIKTTEAQKKAAQTLLPDGPYIGIYTSAQLGAQFWNGWQEHEWTDFILRLVHNFPQATPVLYGAKWDFDLSFMVAGLLNRAGVDFVNIVGKTMDMGTAVECLKIFKHNIGFASGMGILANVLNRPVCMLYPDHLEKLMYSWPCPVSMANNTYVPTLWKRPMRVLGSIKRSLENALDD